MSVHERYERWLALSKALFSAISVCFVIGCLFLFLFWIASSNYFYHVRPMHERVFVSNAKNSVFETSLLIVGTGTALYKQWIEDDNGKVVYTYDDYFIDYGAQNHVRNSSVFIPSLPPGHYVVKGSLSYRANPIKTSEVQLEVGSFVVIDEQR